MKWVVGLLGWGERWNGSRRIHGYFDNGVDLDGSLMWWLHGVLPAVDVVGCGLRRVCGWEAALRNNPQSEVLSERIPREE